MWMVLSLALIGDEIPTQPKPQEIPSKIVIPGTPVPPPPPAPPKQDDLDGAARALREAQEAIRARHSTENQGVGQVPGVAQTGALEKKLDEEIGKVVVPEPAVPPQDVRSGPSPQEIQAERDRLDAQRARITPEAMRRLAEVRAKRAEQISELFGDASRPLNLPLDLAAVPPVGNLKNYPLFLPRVPQPEVHHVSGTRTDELDHFYMAHRSSMVHERRRLEEWTAAQAAAGPDQGYQERWAQSLLAVKSATAGR